jgi:hypothetical protein
MNTSLPDIYNNLNNYSVTKDLLLQLPRQKNKKYFIIFYLKIKLQLNTVVKILGPTLKAPLLNREVITYRNGITDRKLF